MIGVVRRKSHSSPAPHPHSSSLTSENEIETHHAREVAGSAGAENGEVGVVHVLLGADSAAAAFRAARVTLSAATLLAGIPAPTQKIELTLVTQCLYFLITAALGFEKTI